MINVIKVMKMLKKLCSGKERPGDEFSGMRALCNGTPDLLSLELSSTTPITTETLLLLKFNTGKKKMALFSLSQTVFVLKKFLLNFGCAMILRSTATLLDE